jgi:hypothetical protein
VILDAHGIRVALPAGWSGKVFARSPRTATLHAGDFQLPLSEDGEFGPESTSEMPPEASFLALTEYRPGAGLKPGNGLFAPRGIRLPLDPAGFSSSGLAHPRPGQIGMQHFFSQAGRAFCLYVVIAGPRTGGRRQLLVLNHVLGSLRVAPR